MADALGESQDFADGLLTSRGTFQKFFDQQELRNWIDQMLSVMSVPAAPGVFYVFRRGRGAGCLHGLALPAPHSSAAPDEVRRR